MKTVALCLITLFALAGCSRRDAHKPRVAYVTNGVASFWVIAEKGCQRAARDLGVDVDVQMPIDGVGDQKRILQSLVTRGVQGVAISPIDPANQTDVINEAASAIPLITHDSDAPGSRRLCYVGMDNYEAGRMCGKLVKQALPGGGKIMIFVGRIEQLNARQRRQGVIDEILDRPGDSARFDLPGHELKAGPYVILDTRTDQFDNGKAKAQAEDAIAAYPDLACMVGLFAYNPPKCLAAVKEANKLGQIKIVAFDEDNETLQGIADGHIHGTIVQNPYEYGYQSVRILAGLARGDRSVLPPGNFLNIPARVITRSNVESFRSELKKLVDGSDAAK